MHELSLCEGILQVLEKEAEKQGFTQIKNIWLEIGDLAGVETDALLFCFDTVIRDSIADGAKLHIKHVPGQGTCLRCGKHVTLTERFELCPECGSNKIKLTSGTEMNIKEVEVI